jgi:DNA-binding beta-propeller fold protein YncE
VVRVDPQARTITDTYRIGGDPLAVAVSGGRVWVADGSSDQIRTVFPQPTLAPITLKSAPRELVPVGSGVWVAAANPGRVVAASISR